MHKPRHSKENIRITFQMAWPSIVESFFVAFAGLIDSLMVSSLGSYAVAAVGLTTQPKFIGLSLFFALNVSISALVARRRGEEKPEEANRILGTSILFIVVSSVMLSILFVVIFQISQVVYMGCLRGAGDTFYTAVASTISVTFIRTIGSLLGGYVLELGIIGIWLGVLADQISRFLFASTRFKKGKWTQIKI